MSEPRAAIQLGPFELHSLIGSGGMGEVWHGVHVAQGVPVAVKVVTSSRAKSARVRAAFRNEVQSVARLNHRGIVLILDHGLVTPEAEAASDGALLAHSPYLAMELAEAGNLRVLPELTWPQLKAVLLSILDALAHAHARGVVHRDLKPANVLISKEARRTRLKLTDFGIAHAVGVELALAEREGKVSGTPHYMAPEQVLGQWREQGPWTDLYALGCLAHELAAGRPPFWAVEGDDLKRAHVSESPPAIESSLTLPSGFQRWVHRLMAKRAGDRFQLAADAIWSLLHVDGVVGSEPDVQALLEPAAKLPIGRRLTGSDKVVLEALVLGDETVAEGDIVTGSHQAESSESSDIVTIISQIITGDDDSAATRPASLVDLASIPDLMEWVAEHGDDSRVTVNPLAGVGRPPLPSSWRRTEPPRRSMQLVGAGLGLYGLRPIPMVDREDERDRLWWCLRDVVDGQKARVVVLHGAAGNGKSRVAEWIAQRAYEVGAAVTLRASHSPIPGPADGLPRMVAEHLRCADLDRTQVAARAARFVVEHPISGSGDHDALALAELVSPSHDRPLAAGHGEEPTQGGARPLPRVRLSSPEERYAVVRRVLERLCTRRPVIVCVEDGQWGSDALRFAHSLLETQAYKPLPVLMLISIRDESLPERPMETRLLNELGERDDVDAIEIGPLNEGDQAALIEGLLGLGERLSEQVLARTAGNPLFAVQLVGDWVQRGVLRVGRDGFELVEGEQAPLPDDIHELWGTSIVRISRSVSPSNPEPCWRALELAAALGQDVTLDEWEDVCRRVHNPPPPGLVEAMVANRLARSGPTGWSFVHSMVRESLERSAREAARWEKHHHACAEMLGERYDSDHQGIAERLGRHLLAANELEAALSPLLEGAQARYVATDYPAAHALLEERFEAMGRLGLPANDARWGDGWVREARILTNEGRLDDALGLVEQAEVHATQYRWARVLARAATVRGYIGLKRGDTGLSVADFQRSMALFQRVDDPTGLADCLCGLGTIHMWRRELDKAVPALERALQIYQDCDEDFEIGQTYKGLANVYQCWDNWTEAGAFLNRAVSVFEQLGNRRELAGCLNDLGEIYRLQGLLAEAEPYYRRALSLMDDANVTLTSTPRLNLALVLLAHGQYSEAEATLNELRWALDGTSSGTLDLLWVHAGLLPCAAAGDRWDEWDDLLSRIVSRLSESGLVDEDIPWCAQLAGDIALSYEEDGRATDAYRLALEHWRLSGRDEKAAEVERILLELTDSTRKTH